MSAGGASTSTAYPFDVLDGACLVALFSHLSAADLARLACVCRASRVALSGSAVVRHVAASRDWAAIHAAHCAGDLPLQVEADAEWTLERLHLAENPPRFGDVHFQFGSGDLALCAQPALDSAAALLRRHPTLRLRVTGHVQPDCPEEIARALSMQRARNVQLYLVARTAGGFDNDAQEQEALRGTSSGGSGAASGGNASEEVGRGSAGRENGSSHGTGAANAFADAMLLGNDGGGDLGADGADGAPMAFDQLDAQAMEEDEAEVVEEFNQLHLDAVDEALARIEAYAAGNTCPVHENWSAQAQENYNLLAPNRRVSFTLLSL